MDFLHIIYNFFFFQIDNPHQKRNVPKRVFSLHFTIFFMLYANLYMALTISKTLCGENWTNTQYYDIWVFIGFFLYTLWCIPFGMTSMILSTSPVASAGLWTRGVATVRHFRQVPTHNFFPNILVLMKNDKQRITYFNYVCFMFIVLMTSFYKLKDKHLQWVLWP